MSKLDELIQQLCPDGVEYKPLGEVCILSRGKVYSKDYLKDNPGEFPVYSSQTANNGELGRINTYDCEGDYLTWTTDGAHAGTIFHRTGKFSITNVCGLIKIKEYNLYIRFLYYWLSIKAKGYVNQGMGNPKLMTNQIEVIPIPLPPLPVQEEIVRLLDLLTETTQKYQAELEAELATRKKQYEEYRNQLLDLEGKEGVEMKTISQVATNYTGLTYKPSNVSETGTLVLRASNINEDTLAFSDNVFVQMDIPQRATVKENDILICVRNGSKRLVGKAAMITKEAEGMAFGAFMTILRANEINSKFLFYLWQSSKVKKQYKGDEAMPIAQITSKDFQRIIVSVPSKEEQLRIVNILDRMEKAHKELCQSIETEIKMRKQQYEFYRNQLLELKKKED